MPVAVLVCLAKEMEFAAADDPSFPQTERSNACPERTNDWLPAAILRLMTKVDLDLNPKDSLPTRVSHTHTHCLSSTSTSMASPPSPATPAAPAAPATAPAPPAAAAPPAPAATPAPTPAAPLSLVPVVMAGVGQHILCRGTNKTHNSTQHVSYSGDLGGGDRLLCWLQSHTAVNTRQPPSS